MTVSAQEPDLLLPSVEVATIVAEPAVMPVTSPLLFTVATAVLLEFQFSTLLAALAGKTVEGMLIEVPEVTEAVADKVTEVTNTV